MRDILSSKIIMYIKGSDRKIFNGKDKYSSDNIYEISQKKFRLICKTRLENFML